jgi:MFS family permease
MSDTPNPDRALLFVAFICFIDMCGIGLIIPVMPSLLQALTGKSLDNAAEIGGWLLFTYAIMQFLFAPIIGGLSRRRSGVRLWPRYRRIAWPVRRPRTLFARGGPHGAWGWDLHGCD